MLVDADIDATKSLYGKNVEALQNGIVVGDSEITGTLHHVEDYTMYSSDVAEQSGNYLALRVTLPGVEGATITIGTTRQISPDESGIAVLRITDKSSQTVKVVASKTGYDTVTKEFSLTGLTCEKE